jgi:hypothetical protein
MERSLLASSSVAITQLLANGGSRCRTPSVDTEETETGDRVCMRIQTVGPPRSHAIACATALGLLKQTQSPM